jgi:fatty-acyl-CoA synthase
MPRGAAAAAGQLPVPLHCYEELLDAQVGGLPFVWPPLDENAPCGLCYTSGTTGNPKVRGGAVLEAVGKGVSGGG